MKKTIACFTLAVATAWAFAGCSPAPLKLEIRCGGMTLPVHPHDGRFYIEARPGADYCIVLHNRSSRRLAVALSVDGLNTIDARHTSAKRASKWVLNPWQTLEITGWQVTSRQARKFYFTSESDSYGAALGQTANLGVISAVAYFEKAEPPAPVLPAAAEPEAKASPDRRFEMSKQKEGAGCQAKTESAPSPADEYAATGMGGQVDHHVTRISMELENSPCHTIAYRYEYRPALIRLGVLRPGPDRLQERENASGFSREGFCPEINR